MSCYGWEHGEVKLPAAEYSKFKKNLLVKLLSRQEFLFNKAVFIYNRFKASNEKDLEKFCSLQLRHDSCSHHEKEQILNSLIKNNKPVKPKKLNFKLDKKSTSFEDSDLTVRINNETRTVEYCSDDNNHSIEDARESYLGRTVLNLLCQTNYTNQTGGYLKKQTEYDVDAGVGASITHTFGKYTKPQHRKSIY